MTKNRRDNYIFDHDIKFVDVETADKETHLVICALANTETQFTDNEYGECSECAAPIMWRPHAPKNAPKVCIACGKKAIDKDSDDGLPIDFISSEKTREEAPEAVFYYQMARAAQIAQELSEELVKTGEYNCTTRAKMAQFSLDILVNPELEKRWRKAGLPETATSKIRSFMEQTAREWFRK